MMFEKSNKFGRAHTWNIGTFKIGFVAGDYIFNIILFCFDSLSSRISSMLMSPKPTAAPKRRSARGVFLIAASSDFSEVMATALLCFAALAGVKLIIVLPVGTSRGTVIRRSAGISMVCVMVISQIYHKQSLKTNTFRRSSE